MRLTQSRALVLGGVIAVAVGVVVAVASALGTPATTGGVAAAQAIRLHPVSHVISLDGTRMTVTTKPSGAVCFSAPYVSGCASSLADSQLAYATGRSGRRAVLAGVAGSSVKAVIARLTRRGTVWPRLRNGAFYAVLPPGHRLKSIVKVLAGGRRVAFKA